jgi:selenocysteine-specific elongation factor
MHVVATAGHVDHGKSTLVLALTGMDPDRFAEEKARGLTIDLGFAWTELPSGRQLAFVDVPGHVRFIRNMLAGVGAVDACLFVVAATESWKPQSEEHLRILELLGVDHGIIALTKVGLVDSEWRALARLEVEDRVAGTFLAGAEIVEVDAPAGVGLDQLRAALDRLLAATPTAADRDRPRLWVDRSFAAKGSGTVVTGTLAGGTLHVDDELLLLDGRKGSRVRVRALQSHQRPYAEVGPGHRLAVNLTGVSHDRVLRGHALVRPGQWAPTRTVDASLDVLASLSHEVSRRGAYQVYVGSGEHAVRLRVLGAGGGASVPPGGHGLVRLHLPAALPLLPGDRYVLRESGRAETVGGGEVLDVAPVLPASRAQPSRSTERVIAERGWIEVDLLERLTAERRPANVGGHWVVAPDVLAAARGHMLEAVDKAAGAGGLDVATLDDRQRAVLAELDGIVVSSGRAWPAGLAARAAADEALAGHPWLAKLRASPWAPPDPASAGADGKTVRELVRRGLVVERDGAYFAAEAIEQAARVVAGLLAGAPAGVTVAAVRDALGTSRKHVLPILAELDATGITRRRGDLRIAGPRLPA